MGGSKGRRRENGLGGGGGNGGIGGIGGGEDIGPVLAPRTRAGVISLVGGRGEGSVGGGGWKNGAGATAVVAVARFKILATSKNLLAVVDPNCSEG